MVTKLILILVYHVWGLIKMNPLKHERKTDKIDNLHSYRELGFRIHRSSEHMFKSVWIDASTYRCYDLFGCKSNQTKSHGGF